MPTLLQVCVWHVKGVGDTGHWDSNYTDARIVSW